MRKLIAQGRGANYFERVVQVDKFREFVAGRPVLVLKNEPGRTGRIESVRLVQDSTTAEFKRVRSTLVMVQIRLDVSGVTFSYPVDAFEFIDHAKEAQSA